MNFRVPHDYKAGQKGFAKNPRKVFHRSCLYPIVPIGSSQFSKFIDYMRSISLHRLYKQQEKKLYEQHNIILQESCKDVDIPSRVWICVNCWEVLLGQESKLEHVNARHLLTSSMADSEPASS